MLVKIYITLISSAYFFIFFYAFLRSSRLVLLISCSSHTSVERLENALFSITQETQSISFIKKKNINSCAQPEKKKKSQGKMRALLLLVHTDRWQDKSESFPAFSPFRFFDWLSPLYFWPIGGLLAHRAVRESCILKHADD